LGLPRNFMPLSLTPKIQHAWLGVLAVLTLSWGWDGPVE
jgi:hypothetical protein